MSCIMTAIWRQAWRGMGGGSGRGLQSNSGMGEERWRERQKEGPVVTGRPQTDHLSFRFSSWGNEIGFSLSSLSYVLVVCRPPFICHRRKAEQFQGVLHNELRRASCHILSSGVGWGCPKASAESVTWTCSWLSFTPSSLMRLDSWNWS